ncbi:MAG: RepB family plasmid replication initiator protein [Cetobacterium sp.]
MSLKEILYKDNDIIMVEENEINSLLSLQLAFNYILKEAQEFYKRENTETIFSIEISSLIKFCGSNKKNHNSMIINTLRKLLTTEIKVINGKYLTAFTFLSQYEIKEKKIYLECPSTLRERLRKSNYYTALNFNLLNLFKSKYSLKIYEIVKRYNFSTPKISINKFQKITGYPNSYKNNDITRRILEKAKDEIKVLENISLEWEIEKDGRTWKYIRFFTNENLISIIPSFSEKLINHIEKARKNRFVDNSYSQKAMEKLLQKYDEKDVIKALGELYKYNSEIKSFSKILISKIEDIKNSKMGKIKENQGYTLGQEQIEAAFKSDFTEPKKSTLDIEKEKVSNLIRNSDLPTNKRMNLWSQVAEIQNLEELEKFKIEKLKSLLLETCIFE